MVNVALVPSTTATTTYDAAKWGQRLLRTWRWTQWDASASDSAAATSAAPVPYAATTAAAANANAADSATIPTVVPASKSG